jgi:hypothetical protein
MQGYESTLFDCLGASWNETTINLQNVLGVGTSKEIVPWRPKNDLNSIDCSRLCSVISAYRLLDVAAMLDGAPSAPSVDRHFFKVPNASFRVSNIIFQSSNLNCLQGMDKMADWPAALTQFRNVLDKSTKPVHPPSLDLSTPFRLLRLIERNQTNKNYNSIEANFLYAALHMACMKELTFQGNTCPDLPESLDSLIHS